MFGAKAAAGESVNVFEHVLRGNPEQSAEQYVAPDAHFAKTAAVAQRFAFQQGYIFLGLVDGYVDQNKDTGEKFINGGKLIGIKDDRHMITVAGTRAGKGRSAILPNLLTWPHSVLAIDLKGELSEFTSRARSQTLRQNVRVLDPFGIAKLPPTFKRAAFNPLAGLTEKNVVEAAARIADSLVVISNKDPHWDESAKNFIEGVIIHLVTDPYHKNQVHLGTVRQLLGQAGENGLLKSEMEQNPAAGGIVELAAKDFFDRPPNERSSVLSTARRHLKFLDYPEIRDVLTTHDFDLADLKKQATTVYLCLPARHMHTCNRWLRLFINLALQEMERVPGQPASGGPVLFCMDEFATLGHMQAIEDAAGQIAGFGVKLWPIVQDLSQLKSLYQERWESFLANAGVMQFFGNSDLTTLEWISKRCGRTTIKVPRETPMSAEQAKREGISNLTWSSELHELLSVDEIAHYFGRADPQSRQLILRADGLPIILQRAFYDLHRSFRGLR